MKIMNFKLPLSLKNGVRISLGVVFIIAATFHFTAQETEMRLIPAFLPWRKAALYITGIFEFLGGVGMLIPRYQKRAGQGLATLLVAIFPANIYHTFAREQFEGFTRTPLYHILRWPLQIVLIRLAIWSTEPEEL